MIFHILKREEWDEWEGRPLYEAPSLAECGFLHCAALGDLLEVSNCYYKNEPGMALLCIDAEKVGPEIKWETSEHGVSYPHIHGPLNADAIVEVVDFPVDRDGKFKFPKALEKYR